MIIACQDVSACQYVCYKSLNDLADLINDLQSFIIIFNKSHPHQIENYQLETAYYIDRRYKFKKDFQIIQINHAFHTIEKKIISIERSYHTIRSSMIKKKTLLYMQQNWLLINQSYLRKARCIKNTTEKAFQRVVQQIWLSVREGLRKTHFSVHNWIRHRSWKHWFWCRINWQIESIYYENKCY